MNKTFQIIIISIALVLACFGLVSCKTKKTASVEENHDKNKKLKSLSVKKIHQELEEKYLNFNTFSSKLNIEFDNGEKSQSVKANIRISKDSTIWVSIIPALGIEMARVSLTQDSVKFLNKLSSQYFVGDYEYLSNMFHLELDYNLVQDLIMNELFMYPMPDDSIKLRQHFNADNDSVYYYLNSVKEKKVKRLQKKNKTEGLIDQTVIINPDFFKIEEVQINDFDLDLAFNIKYSGFNQNDTTKCFPTKSDIEIKFEEKNVKISLEYSKITLDKSLKFIFSIPEKFQRINKEDE
ncbi:MAG: DUF4292 domain-containing protein [Bacteroidales bacterium]|nr:DUF4292 domain-containing protein [Bacteroidales bacterium]